MLKVSIVRFRTKPGSRNIVGSRCRSDGHKRAFGSSLKWQISVDGSYCVPRALDRRKALRCALPAYSWFMRRAASVSNIILLTPLISKLGFFWHHLLHSSVVLMLSIDRKHVRHSRDMGGTLTPFFPGCLWPNIFNHQLWRSPWPCNSITVSLVGVFQGNSQFFLAYVGVDRGTPFIRVPSTRHLWDVARVSLFVAEYFALNLPFHERGGERKASIADEFEMPNMASPSARDSFSPPWE